MFVVLIVFLGLPVFEKTKRSVIAPLPERVSALTSKIGTSNTSPEKTENEFNKSLGHTEIHDVINMSSDSTGLIPRSTCKEHILTTSKVGTVEEGKGLGIDDSTNISSILEEIGVVEEQEEEAGAERTKDDGMGGMTVGKESTTHPSTDSRSEINDK